MKHWINEGKEILKKWDYSKSQGRSPEQVERNYKVMEYTLLSAFLAWVGYVIYVVIKFW